MKPTVKPTVLMEWDDWQLMRDNVTTWNNKPCSFLSHKPHPVVSVWDTTGRINNSYRICTEKECDAYPAKEIISAFTMHNWDRLTCSEKMRLKLYTTNFTFNQEKSNDRICNEDKT